MPKSFSLRHDTRVRLDKGLMEEATLAAREDGFDGVGEVLTILLRLYSKRRIRLGMQVDEGMQVEGGPLVSMVKARTLPQEAPIEYEERRDVDGFIERVPVEVEPSTDTDSQRPVQVKGTEDPSSECSLFEGSPRGPMMGREDLRLVGVLKYEAELFKSPHHQPQVKWIDQRGDRWGADYKMLTRMGERREKE